VELLALVLHIWKILDSYLAQRLAILTEVFGGFSQSLKVNARIQPEIRQ
jgi:hypothetical protein